MTRQLSSGSPHHLGAQYDGEGTNFAVFSANATRILLCLFSEDGSHEVERLPLPERTGSIWHGYASGLRPGTLYGFRAEGPYVPDQGHRFNSNKLLLDPYARELHGVWAPNSATLGYIPGSAKNDLSFNTRDSAPFVPKSVISDPSLFNHTEERSDKDWTQTLIYEAHPKGLTKQHPSVPENLRGTYDGLASDKMLDHLLKLGITAIELLPVHSFLDEGFLIERKLRNYWGYNSIGFFAPEPRYFGPAGFAGFRAMVRKFHSAGIKVILDVVYNHTAEGDQRGPTLCYRGLDNASYYRLVADRPRHYINDTGCGNTLNLSQTYVLRMVMDSLRFWVLQMGVDGFRFDLATTLCREDEGFNPDGGFLDAIRQDPVLSDVKLIAEPWDIGPGGYRLGAFPPEFAEWNDRFRDSTRRFWRGEPHSAQDLGARLLGSADWFDKNGRRATSSINYITAHDGFTLADLTRYNERHNLPNGENGADGHHANFSDNCGVEGDTDDDEINLQRARRQRNLLATLFLSQGTPMLLAGDEVGNSQQGNNNAYCQDNSTGWVDWHGADFGLYEFTCRLTQFRMANPCLWQSRFLHGATRTHDRQPDVEWCDFTGAPLSWEDPGLAYLCLIVRHSAEAPPTAADLEMVFVIFNRTDDAVEVALPLAPENHHWVRAIDTYDAGLFSSCEIRKDITYVQQQTVVALTVKANETVT